MAKLSQVNPHLDTPEKREEQVNRFVIQSSAIEGIIVSEEMLKLSAADPQTIAPAKKDRRRTA